MDVYIDFRGYQISLVNFFDEKFTFTLLEDEFNEKIQLIQWIDFLVKTNQWIPYDLYKDVFIIDEYKYEGLKNIKEFKVQYLEIIHKCVDINLDKM